MIVAVDPAGGGSSQFAIASVCQLPNGSIAVRPLLTHAHVHVYTSMLLSKRKVAQPHIGPHFGKDDAHMHKVVGGLAAVL